jgi:excisionase family DNA binding protein
MPKAFFSTSEAARLFNINRVTFYRWIKEGKLKAHKVGKRFKIPSEEISRLLKSAGLFGQTFQTFDDGRFGGDEKGASGGDRGAHSGKKQKTIIVIDRDQDIHEFMEASLAELGLGGTSRLKTFSSGIEAAMQIGREDPDVVLLDITMPDLDGLELARKIRDAHGKTRVVLMSRAAAGQRNGDGFELLVKPLNLRKLNKAVGKYLKSGK